MGGGGGDDRNGGGDDDDDDDGDDGDDDDDKEEEEEEEEDDDDDDGNDADDDGDDIVCDQEQSSTSENRLKFNHRKFFSDDSPPNVFDSICQIKVMALLPHSLAFPFSLLPSSSPPPLLSSSPLLLSSPLLSSSSSLLILPYLSFLSSARDLLVMSCTSHSCLSASAISCPNSPCKQRLQEVKTFYHQPKLDHDDITRR